MEKDGTLLTLKRISVAQADTKRVLPHLGTQIADDSNVP